MKPFHAFLCATLFLSGSVVAQMSQQGPKLVGSGAAGNIDQGLAVAISSDGSTAIVGGFNDTGGAGCAWVYAKSGALWSQQGSKLIGTGAVGLANQGTSAALSSDGNTAIFGGYNDDGGIGAAWVFTRSAGVWTQQGTKLVGTGASGAANQGWAVALSADGNTAIVGGYSDNSGAGAAWVFTRSGSTWTQQGSKLVGTGASAASQGYSVALSADGNTAVVGGYSDNSAVGAAWVFTRSGSTWTQQGSKLVGTGASGAAQQGISVSLSSDGSTAVVGGNADNGGAGAVWVFTRSGSTWAQQGSKLVGTGAVGSAGQGYSVAVSGDGTTAMAGGLHDNSDIGAAWVYTRSGSTWTQQGSKVVGSGGIGTTFRGCSVSLSSDGNAAVAGGYGDSGYEGAAWLFGRSGSTWTQQGTKLVGNDGVGTAWQGSSTSLSADGNTAIVGGSSDDGNIGAAWVSTRSGGLWTQQGSKLLGSGASGASNQGASVALSGDGNTAIVGGNADSANAGAAWAYTRTGGVWTQQGNKLVASDPVGSAQLGCSAALSSDGNTAIVGGCQDNGGAGAAWVFTRTGGVWSQQGKLLGTGAVGLAILGWAVALSSDGNTALVGGFGDNAYAGAAWVFTRSGSTWTQQGSKLVGTGAVGKARQALSVALSGDGTTAIVGGYQDNSDAGAIWVFTRSGSTWTQQGSKLVGTGAVGAANQGFSVSVSANGSTAIAGGYNDGGGVGATWVYKRSGTTWTQQGSKLVGTGGLPPSSQGSAVSLSGDANTAIVSGPNDSGGAGAAWVFAALPAANVSGGGAICGGQSATIHADLTGLPPWNLTWSDSVVQNGVAATPVTRSVSPAVTTTYTLTAISNSQGSGTSSGSALVTVGPGPATPTASSNSPVCAGGTLNLSTPAVAGAAYSWTGPNGFVSASQNPTLVSVTTASAGTYSVTISVAGCVSSAPGTTTVTINPDTVAPTVTAPSAITIYQTVCCGVFGGVTPGGSATLGTFVAGGSAVDDCDPSPARLAPQIGGVDVVSGTCFTAGTTAVTFRFRDTSGKTGTASSSATVRMFGDLNLDSTVDPSDMVVLRAYFNFVLAPGTAPFLAALGSADLNHDATVDPSDMVILRAYFNFAIGCVAP